MAACSALGSSGSSARALWWTLRPEKTPPPLSPPPSDENILLQLLRELSRARRPVAAVRACVVKAWARWTGWQTQRSRRGDARKVSRRRSSRDVTVAVAAVFVLLTCLD